MLTRSSFVLALLVALVGARVAPAADLRPMFEALRYSDENFVIEGTVCEEVARLRMFEKYPAQAHEIITGIAYTDARSHRTIGELDVVVIRKADAMVLLVAEVKCWASLSGALNKAKNQRARFLQTLASGIPILLHTTGTPYVTFPRTAFSQSPPFISISQSGGEAVGFEATLGYSLDEMKNLRKQLLSCQAAGQCGPNAPGSPRPNPDRAYY